MTGISLPLWLIAAGAFVVSGAAAYSIRIVRVMRRERSLARQKTIWIVNELDRLRRALKLENARPSELFTAETGDWPGVTAPPEDMPLGVGFGEGWPEWYSPPGSTPDASPRSIRTNL